MMAQGEKGSELRKRQRIKNLAVLAALAGFVVLIYIVSIVRMGGT